MMKPDEIKTATREQLADELGAAGEYTGDWETASMDDLRQRLAELIARYEAATRVQ